VSLCVFRALSIAEHRVMKEGVQEIVQMLRTFMVPRLRLITGSLSTIETCRVEVQEVLGVGWELGVRG
jgi:hypothetical protein